jgi:hypothetical protein
VGIGGPAADLQAHDPRLDHDPTHPFPRPTFRGHLFEPIGCRLAAAYSGASSLPGPLPRTAALSLAAHLSELQRSPVSFSRSPHHLGHESPGIASTAAAIAYAAWSQAEVEDLILGHGRQIAPTS